MSWSELKAPPPAPTGSGPSIKVGVRGKRIRQPFVSIPRAIAESLGIKADQPFRVLLGHGESAGKIKLEHNAEGGQFVSQQAVRGSVMIRLCDLPGYDLAAVSRAASAEYEVASADPLVLVVCLPFPAIAADRSGPPSSRPVAGKDVTAAIMGDPPAKRAKAGA